MQPSKVAFPGSASCVTHKYLILFIFLLTNGSVWAQPVAVISGGVGDTSVQELAQLQRAYNLKFTFALREGDYIAGVKVDVADGSGRKVLEHVATGPILLARLPAGRYVATLAHEGVTQSRAFSLRATGLREELVRWQRSAADGEPLL
jgi:hypothetical protein